MMLLQLFSSNQGLVFFHTNVNHHKKMRKRCEKKWQFDSLLILELITLIFPWKVRKEEVTLPTSSKSFDLLFIPPFGWVRQVSCWINQFYQCMHIYCILTHTPQQNRWLPLWFHAVILRKLLIQCLVNCSEALVPLLEKLEDAPRFDMDFALDLTMCSADFICLNESTIQ